MLGNSSGFPWRSGTVVRETTATVVVPKRRKAGEAWKVSGKSPVAASAWRVDSRPAAPRSAAWLFSLPSAVKPAARARGSNEASTPKQGDCSEDSTHAEASPTAPSRLPPTQLAERNRSPRFVQGDWCLRRISAATWRERRTSPVNSNRISGSCRADRGSAEGEAGDCCALTRVCPAVTERTTSAERARLSKGLWPGTRGPLSTRTAPPRPAGQRQKGLRATRRH